MLVLEPHRLASLYRYIASREKDLAHRDGDTAIAGEFACIDDLENILDKFNKL